MPIIQPTPIDQLPQPPNPADRSNFNSLAYPFTAAMLPLTVQINKAISDMYNNALEAEAKAGEADASATAAANSAIEADTAKTGAETAMVGAESARDDAQSNATAAANSATAANAAKTGAEAARDAAAQSADDAAQSAADAAGAVQGNFGPAIHAATAKGTPADADELAVADSQASWSLKKLTWANLKAAIWAAFKTIATGGNAKDTLGLGAAATRDVGTASGDVMEVGAGGWLGAAGGDSGESGYPKSQDTNISRIYRRNEVDNGVASSATSFHMGAGGSWGRLRISELGTGWIQGGFAPAGTGWTAELIHTGNILTATGQSTEYPMTQKAVTDAINEAVDNIDVSGPRPTKDHGEVATAGSQTVVCNVQESDFHIMSMRSADATGTLTIDFANMPDTVGKHFSWHVRLQRGARKPVAFAQTINWAGGVTPSFGTGLISHDLIMFYKVDNETIRGMVIDAW